MPEGHPHYVTRAELYGVASSLCVLSFMVLFAAPRDDWFNTFTFFFVVFMQIVFAWQGSRHRAAKPSP